MSELGHPSGSSGVRVLQVLPSIVPGGGSEQSLVMLAPLLLERGVDLQMAFLDRGSDLVGELQRVGVVVHDLSGAARPYPSWPLRLHRLVRAQRPDVLHSTLFDADLSSRFAASFGRVRPLSTWANTSYDPVRIELEAGYGGWKREAVRWIDLASGLLSRSRFHAVTRGVADDGIRALHVAPSKVFVVERGRDLSLFTPGTAAERGRARAAMGVDDADTVLVNVARQFHQKGHVHLLAAVDALAATRPDLRLVLVGPPGPATPDVRAALRAMQHPDRVIELGQRTDVPQLLAGADMFVLSSIAEGAAGSVIEAMAAGVPVVSTRVEGLRGCVDDVEHAVLAAPGDAMALAAAIDAVLAAPADAAARADRAREHVTRRFSLDRCADEMAAMYRAVADGVAAPPLAG